MLKSVFKLDIIDQFKNALHPCKKILCNISKQKFFYLKIYKEKFFQFSDWIYIWDLFGIYIWDHFGISLGSLSKILFTSNSIIKCKYFDTVSAQLELDYIFGKIETEEQKEGTKLHERMAEDAVVVKFKELIKNIPQAEEMVIMETTFLMKLNDDIIVGKPDVIIFKRGIPILLWSKIKTKDINKFFEVQSISISQFI